MGDISQKSGYELAAKILESHPNDAVETLLKYSNGAECDWLEFKAGMALLPEDVAKGDKPDDLYWDYLLSIVAMANTRGGAFVIGVNDKTHEAVPLSSCDPRHVIEKEGKEAYLRKEVLDRFDRLDRKWTTKDRVVWSLPTSIVPFLDKRIMPYRGTDVIVLLVSPRKIGEELFVISKTSLGEFEHLPIRDMGEVGHVKRLTKDREFASHRACRGEQLLTSQLGTWWAELDAEQQASKADEILDNAIRAYHVKLEEETRKKLRAFIPLDVEGDEPDEDDEEFENPQAISVFDDDDDAWLNSNIKAGDTSDKGSTGSEVEDEAGDLDDDDEFEDDERETSKRTIKIGLYELLEQQNRVVLVGEPGAGKTTCLAHFAVQQGKMKRPRPHLFAFIALGRWVDGGSVRGLVEKTCGISQAQIDALLAEKRLHLILDALNECPDRLRPGAIENIRILLCDHPDLPVVLSSRKAEGAKLSGIPVFEVQSMGTDRQRLFLERYLHDADAAQKILDSLLKQPGGASIAQNPMLLRMVVDVVRVNGDLPTGRASLYRRWLENWYAREEKKAKKAKDVLPWSKEESIRLLSQMAFAGRAEGYRDIPLDMARHSLGDKDGTFLDRLCQGPLLEIDEGFVHFRHETIQEYLCAEWLLAEPTALDALPKKDTDTWGMPIAYAAELRLPNKLPEEMSEAVWEINPWLAALTTMAKCVPKFALESAAYSYKLAVAIACQNDLLDMSLDKSFTEEILHGQLFLQPDPSLTYVVRVFDDVLSVWTAFECSYVLHFPERIKWGSKLFKQLNNPGKIVKGVFRVKQKRFLTLHRDNLFQAISICFPLIPKGVILTVLADYFVNFSSPRKIRNLFYKFLSGSLWPIDVFFKCFNFERKSSVCSQFDHLFGKDSVLRAMRYLAKNPNATTLPKAIAFLDQFGSFSPSLTRTASISVLKSEFHKLNVLFNDYPGIISKIGKEAKNVYCRRLNQLVLLFPESASASVLIGPIPLSVRQFLSTGDFQRLSTFVMLQNSTMPESDKVDLQMLEIPTSVFRPIIYKARSQGELARDVFEDSMRHEEDGAIREGAILSDLSENSEEGDCSVKTRKHGFLSQVLSWIKKRCLSARKTPTPPAQNELLDCHIAGECISEHPPVSPPLSSQYTREALADPIQRQSIESELRDKRWEMTICRMSKHGGRLFFSHPSFPNQISCGTASTKYADVFAVGQKWSVAVSIFLKGRDFRLRVSSVEPSKTNPVCQPRSERPKFFKIPQNPQTVSASVKAQNDSFPIHLKETIAIAEGNRPAGIVANRTAGFLTSHISIYIDETWPGTQDHAYEKIGVIGGVVVPWEGVDEKKLPVVKTHLDNGSEARNAIQTMLRQSEVFPFVFPIKWDHAVGTGGMQYFELVQHALMLLLGWMLPQRDKPITVDVFLEHISGYMDGHNETDFINSLTQAMRLLSGGRRFANWQIRRVEWVDKEFGYVPYGDLVCKTCVPREEQQLLAREVKVREWEGFLPFSKDVFPLLRDLDTASPSGLADLLISFAKVADDTPFFRRVRKLAIDRAKADEAVCTALVSRFEECYARPDRDMALLNRVVPHFLNEFPPDRFKERPRLQLLRVLIGFQHANHNGDPDLATALVDQYHSLRPRILELDRDLCAYADLNLAVHHHDSFEFDKALSLVDGWINDPLFPALSVMNRGRMYSSRGQSLALLERNQESDEAFARALSIFSAEPALLASDIAQTKTYQAMNALDHDAPLAVPLVEGLLGKSLIATALNLTALLEKPFAAHLFLKTLWRMREGRSVVQDALIKNLPTDIAFRKQHPYELILFYLALLTKEANPSYAKACVREMEQFFEAIEFGGTLGLIHAYMREMLKRHGLNVATDKDFLEELDIVEQYLPKAGTIINEFRMRWGNPSMSIDGILPFNYC